MTTTLNWLHLKQTMSTVAFDVQEGFVEITRHSLALIGLVVVALALALLARPTLQQKASETLMGWLELRQVEQNASSETQIPTAAARSTASHTQDLSSDQASVTRWLSSKYKISKEPLAALVTEAWSLGERSQVSPTLILAVIAIESRFNPFAFGEQGGLGLMQIEPGAHTGALSSFGGRLAVFDPLTNLRVGTRYLQGLIQDAGTLEGALRLYAIASGQGNKDQYVDRVLAEKKLLDNLSKNQKTAWSDKNNPALPKSPQANM